MVSSTWKRLFLGTLVLTRTWLYSHQALWTTSSYQAPVLYLWYESWGRSINSTTTNERIKATIQILSIIVDINAARWWDVILIFPFVFVDYRVLLNALQTLDLSLLTNQQKLAFWINMYNACIMHVYYVKKPFFFSGISNWKGWSSLMCV